MRGDRPPEAWLLVAYRSSATPRPAARLPWWSRAVEDEAVGAECLAAPERVEAEEPLSPLAFLAALSRLPSHVHRHRYHGVLATRATPRQCRRPGLPRQRGAIEGACIPALNILPAGRL